MAAALGFSAAVAEAAAEDDFDDDLESCALFLLLLASCLELFFPFEGEPLLEPDAAEAAASFAVVS